MSENSGGSAELVSEELSVFPFGDRAHEDRETSVQKLKPVDDSGSQHCAVAGYKKYLINFINRDLTTRDIKDVDLVKTSEAQA